MRVRVKNKWYSAIDGHPVMVELSDSDKQNINRMPADAHRYAEFDDNDRVYDTVEKMHGWVNEVYVGAPAVAGIVYVEEWIGGKWVRRQCD